MRPPILSRYKRHAGRTPPATTAPIAAASFRAMRHYGRLRGAIGISLVIFAAASRLAAIFSAQVRGDMMEIWRYAGASAFSLRAGRY